MPSTIQQLIAGTNNENAVARYICGLGQLAAGSEEIGYMVFLVIEDDSTVPPTRLLGPYGLSDMMTREQADHLYLQLGNALGLVKP
jgi:hypothetical protein